MWSAGVILYILLSGSTPFCGKNDHEIMFKVCEGAYEMTSPVWDNVSDSAKQLIRGLLEMDPERRLSAKEALESEWIKSMSNGAIVDNNNHNDNQRVNSISSLFPNANAATFKNFNCNYNNNNNSIGDTPYKTSVIIGTSN